MMYANGGTRIVRPREIWDGMDNLRLNKTEISSCVLQCDNMPGQGVWTMREFCCGSWLTRFYNVTACYGIVIRIRNPNAPVYQSYISDIREPSSVISVLSV